MTIDKQIQHFDKILSLFSVGSISFFIGIFAHRIGALSVSEPFLGLSMILLMPIALGALFMVAYGLFFQKAAV